MSRVSINGRSHGGANRFGYLRRDCYDTNLFHDIDLTFFSDSEQCLLSIRPIVGRACGQGLSASCGQIRRELWLSTTAQTQCVATWTVLDTLACFVLTSVKLQATLWQVKIRNFA